MVDTWAEDADKVTEQDLEQEQITMMDFFRWERITSLHEMHKALLKKLAVTETELWRFGWAPAHTRRKCKKNFEHKNFDSFEPLALFF